MVTVGIRELRQRASEFAALGGARWNHRDHRSGSSQPPSLHRRRREARSTSTVPRARSIRQSATSTTCCSCSVDGCGVALWHEWLRSARVVSPPNQPPRW